MRAQTARPSTYLEPSVSLDYKINRIFGGKRSIRIDTDEDSYTEISHLDGSIQLRNVLQGGVIKDARELSPEEAYLMRLMAENGDAYDRRPSETRCRKCDRNIPFDHRFFGREHGFAGLSVYEWHYKCPQCGHCEVVWNGY